MGEKYHIYHKTKLYSSPLSSMRTFFDRYANFLSLLAYVVQNRRPPRPIHVGNSGSTPKEQVIDYPWFIPTCKNRANAAEILSACSTIEVNSFRMILVQSMDFRMGIFWFVTVRTKLPSTRLHSGSIIQLLMFVFINYPMDIID